MPRQRKSLTRDNWIKAARKVFVASGIDDVKVDRLARRLKVTRGSFYWHFKDRKDLLDALLHDWEAQNKREIDEVRGRWAAAKPDHADIVRIWLGEDPAFPTFDIAVRIWARKTPRVADVVHRVDDRWIELLQILFRYNGQGETESFVRARVVYFHQIGYYALAIREDIEERLRLVPYYSHILTGQAPDAALAAVIDELRAKHSKFGAKIVPATTETRAGRPSRAA